MKKLFLTITLMAGIAFHLLGATPLPPAGTGTSVDPYRITNLANLYWVSQYVDYSGGKFYTLTTNIDASETATWLNGFPPIGNGTSKFSGYFIGSNYTIANLHIERASDYYTGLFGYLKNGTVTGIHLKNCYIQGGNNTGGLIGFNDGGTVLSNYVQGIVKGGDVMNQGGVGGLIGYNKGTVQINQTEVSVSGYNSVGGLVGINTGEISGACSKGSISGNEKIGGLVGESNASGTISLGYSHASVSGNEYVGGLIGHSLSQIYQTYAVGKVTGNGRKIGGLIGYTSFDLPAYSFWDIETTGVLTSYGGAKAIGMRTQDMKKADYYISGGWDFTNYWKIDAESSPAVSNNGYPYLRVFDAQPPVITKNLENLTVAAGSNLDIKISAIGSGTLSYAWSKNGVLLTNSPSPVYSLTNISPEDAGYYYVTVSNSFGSVTSAIIFLTVTAQAPEITEITEKLYVTGGKTAKFHVTATGDNLNYQWYHNDTMIPFANKSEYQIDNPTIKDAGTYSVKVSNNSDGVVSAKTALWFIVPMLKNSSFAIELYGPVGEEFEIYSSTHLKTAPELLYKGTTDKSPYTYEDKGVKTTEQRYFFFK